LLIIIINLSKKIIEKIYKKLLKKIDTLVIYIDTCRFNKKIEATIVLLYKTIKIYLELNIMFIVYQIKLYKIISILILIYISKQNKIYITI
jgi:hypothetical protein